MPESLVDIPGLNDTPPVDENGIDLSLIDSNLALTPAERLEQAEQLANAILELHHARGIEWSDSEIF